ncbi:hypothetical protein [Chiayiivirga flava]|uniref:Lipoprotein n=1 Tax=Chiayiivirga flava TaxID=659595 RepID=A0A7W8G1B1_9GAMM|nr:hypothetical protein [Chiayiivirga flava]MBB5209229.1 hypothetical protein [Chiayiivirga flava]
MKSGRFLAAMMCAGVLAGCGGRADQAATACEAAVAERLPGEQYAVDRPALVASAREEEEDVLLLKSGIVFKPGLPGEYRQQLECKVRFGGDAPAVIALAFVY